MLRDKYAPGMIVESSIVAKGIDATYRPSSAYEQVRLSSEVVVV